MPEWDHITEDCVDPQIRKIDVSKASGLAGVNSKVVKIMLQSLLREFTELLNLCLEKAIFPEAWKLAVVVGIPKSGDVKNLNNIRPISLLPIPGKILEHFINQQIVSFLESKHLLTNQQMGFRKGRSTVESCLGLIDKAMKAINRSSYLLAVFVHLAKTFNTVNHSLLLTKLRNLGLSPHMVALLDSYLSNRRQSVVLSGISSEAMEISDGVPQGSILGPTLFICYISALVSCNFEGGVCLDDTAIYFSDTLLSKLEDTMNKNLEKLVSWTNRNHLTINAKKTKYLLFRKSL